MERSEVIRTIQESAQEMLPRLIQHRRDFHKYAEGGWREIRTSSLIARRLSELGYTLVTGADFMEPSLRLKLLSPEEFDREYTRALAQGADPEFAPLFKDGFTGLMGVLRFGDGPTLAMRFDIDALGISETDDPVHPANRDGYASVNPGFMHACGHDAHATVGLGVAEALVRIKDQLHGTVKLIFQPHEEGVAGSPRAMIAKGHLQDVDYFLSSHITKWTEKDEGTPAVYPGTRDMRACSIWGAVFHGKAVHAGSMPHQGHDALLAAATAVVEMNAIPRHGVGASRVSIGKFRDDSAINAISDEVSFDFEVRGQTTEICEYMLRKAKNVIEHAAAMHECTVDLTEKGISGAFTCSPSLMQRVRRVCSEDLGLPLPAEDARKCGGSEDISFYLNAVQAQGGEATFMRIMSEIGSVAHARDFQILDEETFLPRAVTVFTALCYDLMQ